MKQDLQSAIFVGSLTGRRYSIESQAGAGGMGVVYRARDEQTREPFALKILVGGSRRPMLDRIGQLSVSLESTRHPAIVRVLDYGESQGQIWVVSELLHGRSLEDEIDRRVLLAAARVRDIALCAADALAAAHEQRLDHLDLKASNVVLCDDGGVKVLGVGLLNAVAGDDERVRGLLTTPASRAPELSFAESADHRVDVYALGALMFRLLTGHHALALKSEQLLASRLGARPPKVSALVPDVPSDLEEVIQRAMAPNPKDRFRSMRELQRALGANPNG